MLFGVALSSDGDPFARTMACHALCACKSYLHLTDYFKQLTRSGGSRVRDPLARRCLLDLLRKTESENGWPWAFVSQRLSQEWHLP